MFDVPASAETLSPIAPIPLQSADSPQQAVARPIATRPGIARPTARPPAARPPAARPPAAEPLSSLRSASEPPVSEKKDPEALAAEITTLAGHLNAAQYRFLKLLEEFDREQGWAGPGVRSLAHWLSWKCGIGELAAREKVRVARALRELPMIDASFERGQISYSKVRAMTRAATPENEAQLLNIARHGTAEHMERLVRVYRRCRKRAETSPGETERRREERFYCFDEDEETMAFGGRVSAEQGRLLMKALDAMVAEMEADEREAGDAPQADDAPAGDAPQADVAHRSVDTHQADDEPEACDEARADEIGKVDHPGKADHHSPNDTLESAENVSAETSVVASEPGVSAETSVTESGAGGSSESSAPAPGRNVSTETPAADYRKNVSAETSVAAAGKNVSAETFSDGRSGVEPHESHESRESRESHESDRPPLKPLRVRRATALAQIAEHYLATRSRGAGASPLRSSDAYQVFVHVNANDAHPDNRLNGGHTTYTDDRRCLAPHVARQLACDASRRTVLENERGEVLNIGRRSRIVPWHIAHALRIRDGGCRFPGCNQHRWTDAHHIRHWADGGETSLENLVTLCRYHHRELHRNEYRIEQGTDGELIFMDAQQRAIPPALHPQFGDEPGSGGAACVVDAPDAPGDPDTPDVTTAITAITATTDTLDVTADASATAVTTTAADRLEQLQAEHRRRGVEIDKSTAVTRWAGERMDYSTAIEWLLNRDGVEV